ncbi:MAG: peptidase family protein [Frankiales bacterium]|nr:peptidase family protein [Frankiales bacterium]
MRPGTAGGSLFWVLVILALLWSVVGINALVDHRLLRFGIKPREIDGLYGVVLSPFLHVNAQHLAANSVPLAVFGWLILLSGTRQFLAVTISVIVLAGFIDWGLGPAHSDIVGASGVIFGWFGYVLARAWFSRNIRWIAAAVGAGAVFSGLFAGLLPSSADSDVFWGGHLTGFVVGVLTAAVLHRRRVA